ncbi:MAG: hypothetical protein HGB22_04815 [Chlorobiaceae bacterium]|nr:hypothetical protein [Chlorobiaceae bacterium]
MNYSFKTLWNRTFYAVGPLWAALAWMIWTSGQLKTEAQHYLFLSIVIPGFILMYVSGFLIEKSHTKKMRDKQS